MVGPREPDVQVSLPPLTSRILYKGACDDRTLSIAVFDLLLQGNIRLVSKPGSMEAESWILQYISSEQQIGSITEEGVLAALFDTDHIRERPGPRQVTLRD